MKTLAPTRAELSVSGGSSKEEPDPESCIQARPFAEAGSSALFLSTSAVISTNLVVGPFPSSNVAMFSGMPSSVIAKSRRSTRRRTSPKQGLVAAFKRRDQRLQGSFSKPVEVNAQLELGGVREIVEARLRRSVNK